MGWALHYFPFYLMSRQLFLHHYFPALWFSILMCCTVFDLLTSALRPRVRLYIAAGILALSVWSFMYFSPLAYAGPWTRQQCENARWLKTWDFACNDFPLALPSSVQVNKPAAQVVSSASTASVVTVIGGEAGGRAPVAVKQDILKDVAAAEGAEGTTKGLGAVPEPGHNAFADADDGRGIKSESQLRAQEAAREKEAMEIEKVFSTVTDPPTITSEAKVSTAEDPAEVGVDAVVEDPAKVGVDAVDKPETTTTEKTKPQEQRPLENDAMEAEIAREDLFADGS